VIAAVQRALLQVWRRVPRLARRWAVRVAAPSFTVGAACVIERDDGAILLVRLVYREAWGLPGGLVKRREDIATCGRREVKEEIGLDVELTSQPAVVVDSRPQRVDVVFRARPAPGVDPATARPVSAEIREVRWFPADEMPRLQHEAVTALMALASSTLDAEAEEAPSVATAADPGPGADDRGDGAGPGRPGGAPPDGADRTLRRAAAQAAEQRATTR
jgi:8-oxo-dGTP diphosphatase